MSSYEVCMVVRRQFKRPVHTYSIVARDKETGELGIAVQSHYFGVGAIVPWAEAGVGAVATQSLVRVDYGPRGLQLMREGHSAPQALANLLAEDDEREVRQEAMIDGQGDLATHTGTPSRRRTFNKSQNVGAGLAPALMVNESVWAAMMEAYETTAGDFALRLVAALEAAQAAGGDIRGQTSQQQSLSWQEHGNKRLGRGVCLTYGLKIMHAR